MSQVLKRRLLALCLAAFAGGVARAADCAGTHQIDRCLVGTWKMTANGMERWMREHIHKFHTTTVSQTNNTITLRADGTFATGASDVTVKGTNDHGVTGTGHMTAQASGQWSAADGKFNLCSATSSMNGTSTVEKDGHAVATVPLHPQVPPVSSTPYTCAGNTFTTTTHIRSDSVESIYTKISP